METKRGNGLVVFLIIILIILTSFGTLIFTGVIKSPFIEEKKCDEEKITETKEEKNEVKETRYYQFRTGIIPNSETEDTGEKFYEIKLNPDGTAETGYLRVLDTNDKKGIYTEDDKYIIIALNNNHQECYEGNYEPMIADVCSETMILIKDGDTLKYQRGTIYHFNVDNEKNAFEFKKVEKADLQTSLKN